jgi:hypothetical protein
MLLVPVSGTNSSAPFIRRNVIKGDAGAATLVTEPDG